MTLSRQTLDRGAWTELCDALKDEEFHGPIRVGIQDATVDIEVDGGRLADITIYAAKGATDVRVGRVQLLVGRDRAALVVSRGPYPLKRWDLLWEGTLDEEDE